MLSISDWISIICASISLGVTIWIAIIQKKQSKRMEEFEMRQDKRDQQRYQDNLQSQAISFISKYSYSRGLIPLCAIASMYNGLFPYNREMYRNYSCLTKELQNEILKYCGLDLRVTDVKIYEVCLNELNGIIKRYLPNDKNLFYNNGKYLERCLTNHSKEFVDSENDYQTHIPDVLSKSFDNCNQNIKPIQRLFDDYNFHTEKEACQTATFIAKYIAIYGREDTVSDKNYGYPNDYLEDSLTMEDLFLSTLFELYINTLS